MSAIDSRQNTGGAIDSADHSGGVRGAGRLGDAAKPVVVEGAIDSEWL